MRQHFAQGFGPPRTGRGAGLSPRSARFVCDPRPGPAAAAGRGWQGLAVAHFVCRRDALTGPGKPWQALACGAAVRWRSGAAECEPCEPGPACSAHSSHNGEQGGDELFSAAAI